MLRGQGILGEFSSGRLLRNHVWMFGSPPCPATMSRELQHGGDVMTLEDLAPGASVRGIVPDSLVSVVSVQWFGSEALELTYKTAAGNVANILLYRDDEPRLEVVEYGRPWSFDGDGALFRLVSEAQRIHLAHPVSYTHLRAHETRHDLVCRLLL